MRVQQAAPLHERSKFLPKAEAQSLKPYLINTIFCKDANFFDLMQVENEILTFRQNFVNISLFSGCDAIGSVSASQAGGCGFDPRQPLCLKQLQAVPSGESLFLSLIITGMQPAHRIKGRHNEPIP